MRKSTAGSALLVLSLGVTGCGTVDNMIERQIEEVGAELTGVEVLVDGVDVKLRRVSGEIEGIHVDNPPGYHTEHAFDMGLVRLNLGLVATIAGKPIVIDELVIDSPVVNLEFREDGGSNLRELAQNIERNKEPADNKSAEIKPTSKDKPEEPKRIRIHRLVIEGVTLNVRLADGTEHSGMLPPIELSEVGGEEGVTPAGLGTVVIVAIAREALRQAIARQLVDGDIFTGERMMGLLEQELHLSAEQRSALAPVVEQLTNGLNGVVEGFAETGFVDVGSLGAQFAPVIDEVRPLYQQILEEEQVQRLEELLAGVVHGGADIVRAKIVERLGTALDLTPEQLEQAAPVLRQHLEQAAGLVDDFLAHPERAKEQVDAAYDAILERTRMQLEELLGGDKVQAIIERLQEIRQRIRDRILPASGDE